MEPRPPDNTPKVRRVKRDFYIAIRSNISKDVSGEASCPACEGGSMSEKKV